MCVGVLPECISMLMNVRCPQTPKGVLDPLGLALQNQTRMNSLEEQQVLLTLRHLPSPAKNKKKIKK